MKRTVLLAALGFPASASAATWTVCSTLCDYASLSSAHDDVLVADGDTLEVSAGAYEEDALVITKDLMIVGAGSAATVLTRSAASDSDEDILTIDGATLTMSGFTIEPAGAEAASVRAVDIAGHAVVTMSDIRVATHEATVSGVAFRVHASALDLSDSVIDDVDSSSGYAAGGLYAYGDSETDRATVTLTDVDFVGCDADDGHGGALYVDLTDLVTTDGSVVSSTAFLDGGGVYIIHSNVEISGTAFESNASGAVGGHLRIYESDVTVDGATFHDGSAAFDGGSIRLGDDSDVVINASTFTLGAAPYGGHILSYGGLTLHDSSLDGGVSTSWGGNLYVEGSDHLDLAGTTFSNGVAASGGGGIAIFNSSGGSIDGCTFTGNQATVSTGTTGGGALEIGAGATGITVTDSVFEDNTAGAYGGAVLVLGSATISGSSFGRNSAVAGAGAIGTGTDLPVTIADSVFEDNTSSLGGALILSSTTGSAAGLQRVLRSRFCGNVAAGVGADGGAIAAYALGTGATHLVANNVFVGNAADARGGALYAYLSRTLEVRNNHVLDSASADEGGGMFTYSSVRFVNNLVAYTAEGDGLYGDGVGEGIATYGAWYDNTATDASGAVVLDATNLTATDPRLFDYTKGGGCAAMDVRPRWDSPLRDAGDPTVLDLDGTTSDIGAFGGPDAAGGDWADLDGDGTSAVYDCDDADPALSPAAAETCDGVDEDCDGLVDEEGPSWRDADGDGWGDAAVMASTCPIPSGYVANADDCDDADGAMFPGADERCNDADDDCDDTIDEEPIDRAVYYADSDGDGFGDPATATEPACDGPEGFVTDGADCDDGDGSVHPGAVDAPGDGIDQDCEGGDRPGESSRPWTPGGDTDEGAPTGAGCGCASSAGPGAGVPLALLLVALRRRRPLRRSALLSGS